MCQHTLAALLSDLEQGMQVWDGWPGLKLAGIALFPQNVLKNFKLAEWFVAFCFVAMPGSQGLEAKA